MKRKRGVTLGEKRKKEKKVRKGKEKMACFNKLLRLTENKKKILPFLLLFSEMMT